MEPSLEPSQFGGFAQNMPENFGVAYMLRSCYDHDKIWHGIGCEETICCGSLVVAPERIAVNIGHRQWRREVYA